MHTANIARSHHNAITARLCLQCYPYKGEATNLAAWAYTAQKQPHHRGEGTLGRLGIAGDGDREPFLACHLSVNLPLRHTYQTYRLPLTTEN